MIIFARVIRLIVEIFPVVINIYFVIMIVSFVVGVVIVIGVINGTARRCLASTRP